MKPPTVVKTRWKSIFLFLIILAPFDKNHSFALVLEHCSGVYAAMIKRQSQLLF